MSVFGWISPRFPEASDGILTSAGICEGFAGAGVGSRVLFFAGFAGLVAGTLAMGAVEYSKLRAEHDQQAGQLAAERALLETAPEAELDELTAHAEAEYGITAASRIDPLRDALAVSGAFAAGALLPWLAIVLIPGTTRAIVTFVVVL